MLKTSLDLPTKEEVLAQSNKNNNNSEKKNEIGQINNDDSKINIINKKTSLLPSILNIPPAPSLNKNDHKIISPLNQNGNNIIINNNPNQSNINNNPNHQFNINNNPNYQFNNNDNLNYQFINNNNPNYQFNNNNYQNNQSNINNYQSNFNNNFYQKPMPNYNPNINQINVIQPVIVDSSYNNQNIVIERERRRSRAICAIILFYLSWCFNHILIYLCCLIIRHFRIGHIK